MYNVLGLSYHTVCVYWSVYVCCHQPQKYFLLSICDEDLSPPACMCCTEREYNEQQLRAVYFLYVKAWGYETEAALPSAGTLLCLLSALQTAAKSRLGSGKLMDMMLISGDSRC